MVLPHLHANLNLRPQFTNWLFYKWPIIRLPVRNFDCLEIAQIDKRNERSGIIKWCSMKELYSKKKEKEKKRRMVKRQGGVLMERWKWICIFPHGHISLVQVPLRKSFTFLSVIFFFSSDCVTFGHFVHGQSLFCKFSLPLQFWFVECWKKENKNTVPLTRNKYRKTTLKLICGCSHKLIGL